MATPKLVATTEFKIEKNVPLVGRQGKEPVFPFRDMEIGDSFEFGRDQQVRVQSAATAWGKKNNKKFSVRKTGDGIARCWRIA